MRRKIFLIVISSVFLISCVSENKSISPNKSVSLSNTSDLHQDRQKVSPRSSAPMSESEIAQISEASLKEVAQTVNDLPNYEMSKNELDGLVAEDILTQQDVSELAPVLGGEQ